MSTEAAALNVDSLEFQYPGSEPVLKRIDLQLGSTERVGLVGPSGAGKSTLLLHLCGLLPERLPDDESPVTVQGIAATRDNARDIRSRVGLVFQDPDDQLFCPTVWEDVAFGPSNQGLSEAEVTERVRSSLATVGLGELEARSTMQLSFGERKRICVAGVLACRPELLLLDEPSANLDPRARRVLMGILEQFEGAQLIASHDLDLVVQLCNRVVVIDQGEIVCDGPPHAILGNAELMERHGLEVPLRLRCQCDFEDAN